MFSQKQKKILIFSFILFFLLVFIFLIFYLANLKKEVSLLNQKIQSLNKPKEARGFIPTVSKVKLPSSVQKEDLKPAIFAINISDSGPDIGGASFRVNEKIIFKINNLTDKNIKFESEKLNLSFNIQARKQLEKEITLPSIPGTYPYTIGIGEKKFKGIIETLE